MIKFSKDLETEREREREREKERETNTNLNHGKGIEEASENHYIHQLTMQTMVNRDVLRKINERKQRSVTTEPSTITLRQLQEMVRELWEVTQTKEFSLDMNSAYPYELQKSFDQFVVQARNYLEKHPDFMNLPLSPHSQSRTDSHMKSPITIEKNEEKYWNEKKGEEDTKEIHMLPVFMEKQHPLWNYNHFNRKKAVHAYPPNSEFHIPTAQYGGKTGNGNGNGGGWRKAKIHQDDMLFAEDMDD
jgi:hypothetical protein